MSTWLRGTAPWSKEGLLMQAWTFEVPACGNCPFLYCLTLQRKDWLYDICKNPSRSHRLLLNSPWSLLGQTKWARVPPPFLVSHVPQILTTLEAPTGHSPVSLHPTWAGRRHISTHCYRCPKCQAEDDSSPQSAAQTPPPSVAQHTVHFVWDEHNCEFIFLLVTTTTGSLPAYTQLCQWGVKFLPDHIKVSVDL